MIGIYDEGHEIDSLRIFKSPQLDVATITEIKYQLSHQSAKLIVYSKIPKDWEYAPELSGFNIIFEFLGTPGQCNILIEEIAGRLRTFVSDSNSHGLSSRIVLSKWKALGSQIRFKCTSCGRPLTAKPALSGKKAACPSCKALNRAPVRPELLHEDRKELYREILRLLKEGKHSERRQAVVSDLCQMVSEDGANAVYFLVETLNDINLFGEAMEAIELLGEDIAPIIGIILTDLVNYRLAEDAVRAVEKFPSKAIKIFMVSLASKNCKPQIKEKVLESLARLGQFALPAIPTLVSILQQDGTHNGRRWNSWKAADCLGAIGPNASVAIPVLVEFYQKHSEYFPRTAAKEAIQRIDPSIMANLS